MVSLFYVYAVATFVSLACYFALSVLNTGLGLYITFEILCYLCYNINLDIKMVSISFALFVLNSFAIMYTVVKMAEDIYIVMAWLMGGIDFKTAQLMMEMRLEGWNIAELLMLQDDTEEAV